MNKIETLERQIRDRLQDLYHKRQRCIASHAYTDIIYHNGMIEAYEQVLKAIKEL